jgi:hypothetical protein
MQSRSDGSPVRRAMPAASVDGMACAAMILHCKLAGGRPLRLHPHLHCIEHPVYYKLHIDAHHNFHYQILPSQ